MNFYLAAFVDQVYSRGTVKKGGGEGTVPPSSSAVESPGEGAVCL